MTPTVSIIVPVYNAQDTISRCVESILGQEYTDFELLLVDDGSQDDSGAICDSFAAADPRVRVLHKENTGVSDTRNRALDQARGTYLQFLDSDDWITPDATKLLVRAAQEHACDLVISDFYRVVGERVSHKGDIEEDTVLTREEYAAHMMENPADFYYGVLWNKLYRREIHKGDIEEDTVLTPDEYAAHLMENTAELYYGELSNNLYAREIVEAHHLRMDPEISWCEDFMFNLEYIRQARSFYALQVPVYYYVKTKGSLANQNLSIASTVRMKLTVFEYYNRFFRTVFDEEDYERSRLKVYKFLIDAAQDGAVPPAILPGSQRLGEERTQAWPDALAGTGCLYNSFRDRKLLDYCLEPAALKHDLTLAEARLLLALEQLEGPVGRRELAEFAGISRTTLARAAQKLAGRGLVTLKERRDAENRGRVQPVFSPEAQPVLEALDAAQRDWEGVALAGFTQAETETYRRLQERMKENVRRVLL